MNVSCFIRDKVFFVEGSTFTFMRRPFHDIRFYFEMPRPTIPADRGDKPHSLPCLSHISGKPRILLLRVCKIYTQKSAPYVAMSLIIAEYLRMF